MSHPAKNEALNRCNGQGFGGQATDHTEDSASGDALQEAITRMKVRASQCGCSLHEMADGGYLLCRWGHCKEVPCLRAVGALLRRIGGQHG